MIENGDIKENNNNNCSKTEFERKQDNNITDFGKKDYLDIKQAEDWNQFEINKNKFNVNTDYREELYTTELNKNNLTKEEIEKAERIEKVIVSEFFQSIYLFKK